MNNLFIALSTHHLKYCEKIADLDKTSNNIIITNSGFNVDTKIFDRIVFLNKSAYNQSNSFISKAKHIIDKSRSYSKAVNEISDLKNAERIRLYYSSLEDILSNYLLFNFNKNVEGIVIEDGVLNYYEHTLEDVSKLTFNLKKLIGLAYGLKLKNYEGHTTGIDYDLVKCQLVREPSYSIRPQKSARLPLDSRKLSGLNNNILIVGQEPYGNMYGKRIYIDKLKQLISHINLNTSFKPSKTVYYKPHRHGPRIDVNTIKEALPNNHFIYLDNEVGMEDLFFENIKCKNIYTFDSSAVFSIYSEAPDKFKDQLNIYVMPFHRSVLNKLFKQLKFTILNNDI
ncbi:MAG: hypothetical protein HKN40_08375 [Winogradskyella sp.]|uniref:hypothetical protein n=1 Tax=Winogradskyella sp. TaxID=1883156 RepID=UPI0017A56425|nr:hypothetical protein [Winogradskyella sp.]